MNSDSSRKFKFLTIALGLMNTLSPLRQALIKGYRGAYQAHWGNGRNYEMEVGTAELQAYGMRFVHTVSCFRETCRRADVIQAVRGADIVYGGDFHPLRRVKLEFLNIIKERDKSRDPVILLEEFLADDQPVLDQYLAGKIDIKTVRHQSWDHEGQGSWRGFRLLLEYCRKHKIPVYGINHEGSLGQRDELAKTMIKPHLGQDRQLFVFVGEDHLAPEHLPGMVAGDHGAGQGGYENPLALPPNGVQQTTVLQGVEDIFWQLLDKGIAHSTEAVVIRDGLFDLNNVPPLLRALVHDNMQDGKDRLDSELLKRKYIDTLAETIGKATGVEVWNESPDYTILERILYETLPDEKVLQLAQEQLGKR